MSPTQIDTKSSVKRENNNGNASLSQLLLTSPFSSTDSARGTASDVLGQPSAQDVDMNSSGIPAEEVRLFPRACVAALSLAVMRTIRTFICWYFHVLVVLPCACFFLKK